MSEIWEGMVKAYRDALNQPYAFDYAPGSFGSRRVDLPSPPESDGPRLADLLSERLTELFGRVELEFCDDPVIEIVQDATGLGTDQVKVRITQHVRPKRTAELSDISPDMSRKNSPFGDFPVSHPCACGEIGCLYGL